MIVHSVSQLLTLSPSPQRGHSLGNLGILVDAAIVLNDGVIIEYGPNAEMMAKYTDEAKIDAHNQVVMPGFVDAHTHVVWAGDRAAEFEMRLEGKTYLEILEAGGGILSTVTNTRKASLDQLIVQTRLRLKKMLQHGTT
ncbi:MAG: amidohydrolase family protein, partial [Chloroflexota bacterium]